MKCPKCNTKLITFPKSKRNYKVVKTTPLTSSRCRSIKCLTCSGDFLTEEKVVPETLETATKILIEDE